MELRRDLVNDIPAEALVHGALVNGVQADPMTYIMHELAERFGRLSEEMRLESISNLMTFDRQPHENIDQLLTRFDTVCHRAIQDGEMQMPVQALTWLLLRACQVSVNQMVTLLQQLAGLYPSSQDEFNQLRTQMKRMGHIIERSPGNLATHLRDRPMITLSLIHI